MKKLIFSTFKSFLAIFIFISCATVAFSQGCKFPVGCQKATTRSLVIDIPNYSNAACKVLVTYKQIVCLGSYNIYDFVYLPLGNCGDFATRILNDAQFVKDLDVIAGRQVSDFIASDVIYGQGSNPADYNCNGTPEKVVNVSYYRGSCIAIWEGATTRFVAIPGVIKTIKSNSNDPNQYPFIIAEFGIEINQTVFGTVACGDGCCKLNRRYCNDGGALGVTESTEAANPAGVICSFNTPPPPDDEQFANVTWIQASPCFTICDNIPVENMVVKNKKTLNQDLMFFRNPTSGNLEIKFTEFVSGTVEVKDGNGRLLQQAQLTESNNISIGLSSVPVGMYYVTLKHLDGRLQTKKLVNQ